MKIIIINITKQRKIEINIFHEAHEAINFTIKKGNIDELAFLDVQVRRNKNRFLTLMYIKKTFTGC